MVAEKSLKKNPAVLALADGSIFKGYAFGAEKDVSHAAKGEVVFNTSMYGYQEILTDPSYAGQMLTFTYPHIGNVGCNSEDVESGRIWVEGVLIRELSPVSSNFRSEMTLSQYLERAGTMGVYGIDTRALVAHTRDKGAQMGAMACAGATGSGKINPDDLVDIARKEGSMEGKDYVKHVSCNEPYSWAQLPWCLGGGHLGSDAGQDGGFKTLSQSELWSRPHVVAVDCGIKYNILRILLQTGFRVTVVPATSTSKEILSLRPDALFLSNGPGDPATLDYVVRPIKELIGKLPIFGICLGHQILAQAVGGKTFKLKFGHRGGNHPVKDLTTNKVEITVQNHGFAVDKESLSGKASITHLNLNDKTVEGLTLKGLKAFSVQYHPESSPGPHDAQYLFKRFFEMVVA